MITTTYLLLVLVLGVVLWRVAARRRAPRPGGGLPPAADRWRSLLVGAVTDDDLVERMAARLVERTVAFGSSHAVPSHLACRLPRGILEAATAAREQLTAEVVHRYCALMAERCGRLGRPEFVLPERYALQLALTGGEEELLVASFAPIDDVPAGGPRARPAPAAHPDPYVTRRPAPVPDELDEVTVRRVARAGEPSHTVHLEVAGVAVAERRLDARAPRVSVGRGAETGLRCPDDVEDVSRRHADLTFVGGCCYVEDTFSANGTWLRRGDGEPRALVPGETVVWSTGDVLWLDEDHRATVTLR